MRLLQLHCDYVAFKPKSKALKTAQALTEEEKRGLRLEDVVVLFSSFEAGDDERVLEEAARLAEKDFRDVHASTVLVYPYAHLSNNLAPPAQAVALLEKFTAIVKRFAPAAQRAPFGYYKEFELKCKGHPLAELAKTVTSETIEKKAGALGAKQVLVEEVKSKSASCESTESESLKKEAAVKSTFFVLTPNGDLIPADSFDYAKLAGGANGDFAKFVRYETQKERAYACEPAHIKIMKEQGIARNEPGSDSGNLSWPPKGRLIKKLLERAISDYCISYGGMEVETPLIYDYGHPALKKYLHRFPARQYVVHSDEKEFFLRFAACAGMFLLTSDYTISYKQLPLKMYELTRYSFRREQSGELCGLKRLRAFTMPDMHTFCRDLAQARDEFSSQFDACTQWQEMLEIPIETVFRAQTDFFNDNREWYVKMTQRLGKPVLVELFNERYAYFITKFEHNFIDGAAKAAGLSTVQIDVENAENYDLSFVDEDNSRKRPPILHTSISGAVERVIYAILEREAMRAAKGQVPQFPMWLAPTQVRLVPISEKQNAACEKILAELQKKNVRADFDDRAESMQKKVREAEQEWVPLVCVVGDKEVQSGKLAVRVRGKPKQEMLSADEVAEFVRNACEGKLFEKLNLPARLSKRAILKY
jgi:threonyl-tRNA synthetase